MCVSQQLYIIELEQICMMKSLKSSLDFSIQSCYNLCNDPACLSTRLDIELCEVSLSQDLSHSSIRVVRYEELSLTFSSHIFCTNYT